MLLRLVLVLLLSRILKVVVGLWKPIKDKDMATQSVATIIPTPQWPGLVDIFFDLGYELGDGIPLSASGLDPASHRGLHGYDFVNWEETFQNEAIVSSAGNGNSRVVTSVDSKILVGRNFGTVTAAFNSQQTWTSGKESPLADSELFDALADSLGLQIIEEGVTR